jgi:mono/diheme cytochrome c family protein
VSVGRGRTGRPDFCTPGLMATVLGAALAAACSAPDSVPAREATTVAEVASPTPAPSRFGFGQPPDPALVARWDRDVRPDGAGLPPGQGSVAQGGDVYLSRCVACHGPTGTEGPYDVLVGGGPWGDSGPPRRRTVGNYWPYATTLFDYITRAMPQNAPGSLTADETYAVIAWLLARNGIVGEDAVLDAGSLPAVVMPARDRFVPDDRRGGPEVR